MVEALSPQLAHLSTEVLSIGSPDQSENSPRHRQLSKSTRHSRSKTISRKGPCRDSRIPQEDGSGKPSRSEDENALFRIANQFHIRHKNADQRTGYRPESRMDLLLVPGHNPTMRTTKRPRIS